MEPLAAVSSASSLRSYTRECFITEYGPQPATVRSSLPTDEPLRPSSKKRTTGRQGDYVWVSFVVRFYQDTIAPWTAPLTSSWVVYSLHSYEKHEEGQSCSWCLTFYTFGGYARSFFGSAHTRSPHILALNSNLPQDSLRLRRIASRTNSE